MSTPNQTPAGFLVFGPYDKAIGRLLRPILYPALRVVPALKLAEILCISGSLLMALSIYQIEQGPLRYIFGFVWLAAGSMRVAAFRRMATQAPLVTNSLSATYVAMAKQVSSHRVFFTALAGLVLVSTPVNSAWLSLLAGLVSYISALYAATWLEPPRRMHLRQKMQEAVQRLARLLQPPVPIPVPSQAAAG